MAPLTLEQVLRVAAEYNRQISPLQVLIYVPTLLVFVLLIRGTRQDTSRGVLLLLASQWGIVGALADLPKAVSEGLEFNVIASACLCQLRLISHRRLLLRREP